MWQVEQRSNPLAGMGGAGPDPAALLRLLLIFGRLEEAAALAVSYLDFWDKQVCDLALSSVEPELQLFKTRGKCKPVVMTVPLFTFETVQDRTHLHCRAALIIQ